MIKVRLSSPLSLTFNKITSNNRNYLSGNCIVHFSNYVKPLFSFIENFYTIRLILIQVTGT